MAALRACLKGVAVYTQFVFLKISRDAVCTALANPKFKTVE
jgi:hypothetical protein